VLWDALSIPSFTGWVWREVSVDISSYKSAPFILAWTCTGADGDLMGIDNISVAEPAAIDGGVTAITAPLSSCTTLSSAENVVVTIKNNGTAALTGFPVSYKINNNTPVTVTYSSSIAAGATATYTFTGANAANFSVPGNYKIKAYTGVTGDVVHTNDTATVYMYSGAATIPFAMGFEATDNLTGWTLTDVNADGFYWGIYTGAKYSHTGTGFAAYPYNTNGTTAADDWLFTKCLNLLSGNSYQLKFYYRALQNTFPEAMNVNIGAANTVAGMTTQLVDLPSISDTTYPSSTTIFTVPSSGNYYIGFHCKSAADMAYLILDDVTVDMVTGVSSNENPQDISIYPNPASTMVTVIAPEKITHLKVLDLLGNVVHEEDGLQNIVTLNTSAYCKGIYFVVVTTEKQTFTRKIQIIK
ncbi:MAG: choice-of-anchor J domain-containing protein, partial [Bacteroidota bacterium]